MTDNAGLPPTVKRPRGRPKTLSDDSRRSEIIKVARKTFVDLGFLGTTTEIIAARCKISKRTLYQFFPSKPDLFIAVVVAHRRMMLDLPRPMNEHEDVAETLKKIFLIDITEAEEDERQAFIHTVMRDGDQVPEIKAILHREGVEQSRKMLADWLERKANERRLVIDEPIGHARILMDMLFGAMGRPKNEFASHDDRRRHLERCIAIFVRATAPD